MRQVFGGIILAVGILIAGLSGLCTVLIVGGELISPSTAAQRTSPATLAPTC